MLKRFIGYFILFLFSACIFACNGDDDQSLQKQEVTVEYLLDNDFLMFESIINSQENIIDTTHAECHTIVSFGAGGVVIVDGPDLTFPTCYHGSLTIDDAVDWTLSGDTLFFTRPRSNPSNTYQDIYRAELSGEGIFSLDILSTNPDSAPDPVNGKLHLFVTI